MGGKEVIIPEKTEDGGGDSHRLMRTTSAPANSDGFFLTATDVPDKEKAKVSSKRRRAKRESKGGDWLAELRAMHSVVGDYTGNEVTSDDKKFFAAAKQCENDVSQLAKELDDEDM